MAAIKTSRRVVCTGLGMVSPLGVGVRKSWSELLAGKSGVVALKQEHTFENCKSRIAAYVPEEQLKDQLADQKHLYLVKNAKQLSRATTFAMLAVHEALEEAHLLDSESRLQLKLRHLTGVAMGQGMVDFQDIYDNASLIQGPTKETNGYRKVSPYFMTRALMNMSAGNVAIRYKMQGPNHCVSTACASGAHSIGDAFNFVKSGQADLMVCGSTEASINSLSMAGFERLRALCTKFIDTPERASRPFDSDRAGFVMGEGAGVLILEELQSALARGLTHSDIYCELLGYGSSCDAHHLTAPLPDGGGAKLSMTSAISNAGLRTCDISHVNAHATSTPLGDDIEYGAINKIFTNDSERDLSSILSVTSCKGSLGHLLGAAGSVESIFAILSCKEGRLPSCLNLEKPLATDNDLVKFVQNGPHTWDSSIRTLVKNSFGFGGTNASLVFSNFRG